MQALGCNAEGQVTVVDFMRAADLSFGEGLVVITTLRRPSRIIAACILSHGGYCRCACLTLCLAAATRSCGSVDCALLHPHPAALSSSDQVSARRDSALSSFSWITEIGQILGNFIVHVSTRFEIRMHKILLRRLLMVLCPVRPPLCSSGREVEDADKSW
jgi:hypothetical protein